MSDAGITVWAVVVVIVVIPLLIIVTAELDERLRQRQSPLRPAVTVLRTWGLPFLALWSLLVPVLGLDADHLSVRIAMSGVIVAVAVAVLRVLRAWITGFRTRSRVEGSRAAPQLLLALPRLVVVLVAGWLLVDTVWGVNLSALFTALGVTSLVVSFALQDTLSGLASGLLLLSDQPFKPGDWITIGDTEGQVVDLNWRTTRIRDRNGDVIIVPNSQLAGAAITNYSSPDPLHRVVVDLQVAFVNPPTLAIDMLLDAARSTHGVLAEPPPGVRVTQIDDPLMGYSVDLWIDDFRIEPRVRSEFGRLVWYQSHRHGVPLPSPAQDLYLYDGVAAGESAVPTTSELREGLLASPLLASLSDAELDAMAAATHQERFAVGEHLLDAQTSRRDLLLIKDGHAQMVLPSEGEETLIADFHAGDALGVVDLSTPGLRRVYVRAVTDCVVLVVDAAVVGTVGSRNADLASALNRVATIRRRRVERAMERSVPPAPDRPTPPPRLPAEEASS